LGGQKDSPGKGDRSESERNFGTVRGESLGQTEPFPTTSKKKRSPRGRLKKKGDSSSTIGE